MEIASAVVERLQNMVASKKEQAFYLRDTS